MDETSQNKNNSNCEVYKTILLSNSILGIDNTANLSNTINEIKEELKLYKNEILNRNCTINKLLNCVQNLILKNNEYQIAENYYKEEIECIKSKMHQVKLKKKQFLIMNS